MAQCEPNRSEKVVILTIVFCRGTTRDKCTLFLHCPKFPRNKLNMDI